MGTAFLIFFLLSASAFADTCRVLIEGTGCRTRQQSIERIFEKIPDVTKVTILPRSAAPADNHRYFIIESKGTSPTKDALIEALGRRAKFYKILTVEPRGK